MGSVAVVFSRGLSGLDAPLVRVEAHVGGGLPQFHMADLENRDAVSAHHLAEALRYRGASPGGAPASAL